MRLISHRDRNVRIAGNPEVTTFS